MGLRVLASMISAPGGRSLGRAGTLAFVALAVAACGGQPGLPELPAMPDFFGDKTSVNAADDPPERLYNEGLYLLNNKRDPKAAAKKFEEVDRQHPYSEWARKSLIMSAYAYYDGREYEEAIGAAKRYVTLHPGTSDAAYAQFLIGSSYFDQIPDITRDQAGTEKAVNALEEVARKFPNSEYASSAKKKLEIARDQLAGKEMTTGRYYQEKRDYTAAINRFKNLVTWYPASPHVEEALARLVESYLAISIPGEAQTAVAVLDRRFPTGHFSIAAHDALKTAGLDPVENEKSWISRALK
jgi:outer membrane protein assembly factor BamD